MFIDSYGLACRMGCGVGIPEANFLKDMAGGRAFYRADSSQSPLSAQGMHPPHPSL